MKIIVLLLASLPCLAAGPQYNNFLSTYAISGATNTASITVNAGSGAGYGFVVFFFYRSGSVSAVPTCGGHALTQAGGTTSLLSVGVTSTRWVYFGAGISPGVVACTAATTGGTDNQLNVIAVDGARGTQPDAAPTATTGVFLPVAGGQEAALAITTVAANSLVIGEYSSTVTISATPSSNGTLIGADSTGFGVYYWYSTTNPTAGAYNLQAKNNSGTGSAYAADGLSVAPSSVSVTSNPSTFGIAVQ